ncbi:hypothetical protein BDD26_2394 [Xenorhabdus cabanillasii]|uniref:Uncharacterized protein n=1 Tax=Xenorhabdus cabanillasii TaxID=351673 RepID=A0A3D9USD2_9GAMM|nr:hypothetical protein [Xenorhabdus cabanillasii]REF27601.1 hypothetical protein BDD26_2394 [Xenorhabdus cabanillasii]
MNIDKDTVLSDKKTDESSITVSIPDGADVIIGQHCYLIVTVKSSQVKSIKRISIEDPKNNIVVSKEEDWKLIDDTSGKAIFMLAIDNNLSPNTSVSYIVHAHSDTDADVQGIAPLTVSYTTKKINEWSFISLKTDMEIIEVTHKPNAIDDPNSKYINYTGVIIDQNNNPLKNTQIIISSVYPRHDLEMVDIATVPVSNKTPELVKIQKRKNLSDFFVISSDENGNVGFRVYPRALSVRIEFIVEILGMNFAIPTVFAYVVEVSDSSVPPPQIFGILPGGVIKKETGVKEFIVAVPEYESLMAGDAIIFLIKDEDNKVIQLKPTYLVSSHSKFGGYDISLSYEKIPFNKRLGFYYLVVSMSGDSMYSVKLGVIFEDVSRDNTNNGNNGNNCDDGLYNKVDVDSNYSDGTFSLKIKSITMI